MNTMKYLFALLLLSLALPENAFAQQRPKPDEPFRLQTRAALRTRSMGDSIVLRWALTAQDPWPFVMETGFDLERVEMDAQNKPLNETWQRLNTEPIRPLTASAFKALTDRFPEDEDLKVAAGMLYGQTENPATATNPVGLIKARADEAQNRYGFMLLAADFSPLAATALGLRYADRNIVRGHRYLYRLIVRPTGGGYPQDTSLSFAVATPYSPLSPPVAVVATPQDKAVTLSWKNNPNNPFSAYWIERSTDGVRFERLNRQPYVQMSLSQKNGNHNDVLQYRDSLSGNYRQYYYRVRGLSAFGETSAPSAVVEGNGIDRTFNIPVQISAITTTPKGPMINWTADDRPRDLANFLVVASSNLEGGYEPVSGKLAATEKSFLAPSIKGDGQYFKVVAFDTAGNYAESLPLYYFEYDTIPPPAPVGLSGYMDTTGLVHLNWPMPRDGDTRAFRLYYHNAPDHEPNPLLDAPITDTAYDYQGTAKVLTKNLFIRIAAVDANGNHSALSAPLRIRRPDKIPPTDAVISDYRVTDSAVTLYWQRSNSEDVASQTLFRKPYSQEGDSWQKLATLGANVESYVDRTVKSGEDWYYAVLTTDSSNLNSPMSFPLRARVYLVAPPSGIQNLKAVAIKQNAGIELSWNGRLPKNSALLIARSYNGEGFVPVARLDEGSEKWIDSAPPGKGSYQYRVRQILEDGSETVWVSSNEVSVL